MPISGSSPGVAFASLYYYADLANGSQYRPAAQVVGSLLTESGLFDGNIMFLQIWDGFAWLSATSNTNLDNHAFIANDADRYLQLSNTSGAAKKVSLTGYSWL